MAEEIKDDENKDKKEETPAWATELLTAVKGLLPKESTTEQTQQVPVPPAPATVEEEQDEEEQQTKPNGLKKVWNWLM